jgi:hypothetical protein
MKGIQIHHGPYTSVGIDADARLAVSYWTFKVKKLVWQKQHAFFQ